MVHHAACTIVIAAALAPAAAVAQTTFSETEPNEDRPAATPAGPMAAGDSLSGATTGSGTTEPGPASADIFLVSVAAAPPAIYRHRLVITSPTAGHAATVRGLSQAAAAAGAWPCTVGGAGTGDLALQTAIPFPPVRTLQWYGFGAGEQLYVRITGSALTTEPYTATLETTTVTPVDLGPFAVGPITFTTRGQGHATDTDMWIYDADLNPMAGYANDDNSINGGGDGIGLQSLLTREFASGTYYLAIGSFNLANNFGSPCDDDFRSGALADFPGYIISSSLSSNIDTTFTITDSSGATQVPVVRPGTYDILWYRLQVGTGGVDCNGNGVPDLTDIAANPALDCFNPAVLMNPGVTGGPDGALDACQCQSNFDRDGGVNSSDVSAFLTGWLASVQALNSNADINCSGSTNSGDVSAFLVLWLAQLNGADPDDGCP